MNKNIDRLYKASLLVGLLAAGSAHAFTANVSIAGEEVRWRNATGSESRRVLTDWTPISGLPTTTSWAPGMFLATTPTTINLAGPGGSVEVPIKFIGMEYNLGRSGGSEDSTLNVPGPCAGGNFSGSIASVEDSSQSICGANYSVSTTSSVAPFYFYRPIFEMNDTELSEALNDIAGSGGTFSGTVPLSLVYYYTSNGGALTYYQISETFTLSANVAASEITSVHIQAKSAGGEGGGSTGIIRPEYDTSTRTVSGEVTFVIDAKGSFHQGLNMTLQDTGTYELKGEHTGLTIPYSILCDICEDPLLVDKGSVKAQTTKIGDSSYQTQYLFDLRVRYDDISAVDVETDTYSDTFFLIFEAGL